MSITQIPAWAPNSTQQIQTKEEKKLKGIIEYQQEELRIEIDRGNDLCEIIYKLHNNTDELTSVELQRIYNIQVNIDARRAREGMEELQE